MRNRVLRKPELLDQHVVLHSLHGRSIPVAQGVKLANSDLTVMYMPETDTYGEGLGHLLHAARRNIDITVFVHDNQVYGLTTGQPSPTSFKGTKWKVAPEGVFAAPVAPLPLALIAGATFVGRGFSGENKAPTVPEVITDSVLRFSPTLMPDTSKSGFRFRIAYSAISTASVGVPATAYASCPSTLAPETRIGSKSDSDLPTPLFWTEGATITSLPRSLSALATATKP